MILDFRFLAGIAVGTVIGLVITPDGAQRYGVDIAALKNAVPGLGYERTEVDKNDWPSNEAALKELFRFSKWNYENFGPGSSAKVTRCINIDDTSIACKIQASLSWITEVKSIEALFKSGPDGWHMEAAKSM